MDSAGSTAYGFDALARLIDYNSVVGFTYDGLDRVATRDAAVFEYAGTLIDPTTDGTFTYSRSPGGRLISESDGITPELGGLTRHGDLSYVFDTSGTVNGTRVFDPFGQITASTGSFSSNLGFQADFTDPASGETWMGARWYSSADAVFRSRGTGFGELSTPVSLNRYTYGFASPLVFWDPDGRFGQSIDGICSTATSCLAGVTAISGDSGGGTAGSGVGWSGTQRSEQAFSYAAFMAALGSGANPVPASADIQAGRELSLKVWGFGQFRFEIRYSHGDAVAVPLNVEPMVRYAAVIAQLDSFDPPVVGSTDPSLGSWLVRQVVTLRESAEDAAGIASNAAAGVADELVGVPLTIIADGFRGEFNSETGRFEGGAPIQLGEFDSSLPGYSQARMTAAVVEFALLGYGVARAGVKVFKAIKSADDFAGFLDELLGSNSSSGTGAIDAADDAQRSVSDLLDGLPRGKQANVRVVNSETELQSVFGDLATGGVPTEWQGYKGSVIRRTDGVEIGIRPGSASGGATVDIRLANGTTQRIHIDE